MPKRREQADIPLINSNHLLVIVYDPFARQYYNRRTDIYLSDDDISFYHLRPCSDIPAHLPPEAKENPQEYFFIKTPQPTN